MTGTHGSTTHSAMALLREKGFTRAGRGYVGRHRLVKANEAVTEVLPVVVEDVPPALDVATLELIVQLSALGADVRVVEREPNVCACGGVGDVAVYDGDHYEDLCRECAPGVVRHRRTDAVVVEIARWACDGCPNKAFCVIEGCQKR